MEQWELTYEEAREFLSQASKKGMVLGLSVMEELLGRLGNPEKELSMIHIAGTNGKGSILTYLEQILLASGYHTGRYVSPALGAYEERFLLDGKAVSQEWIGKLAGQVKKAVDEMKQEGQILPTVFEIETAMAFLLFQKAGVSAVLLETGLGGKQDATNVIENPLLSIIASVSMDHMNVLGDNLSIIAAEKAGIIKEGCDTLLYPGNVDEVKKVIRKTCEEKKSCLHEIDLKELRVLEEGEERNLFTYGNSQEFTINLPGSHQILNGLVAIEAAKILKKWFAIEDRAIAEGLAGTRWNARLQKVSSHPSIYLDGAHNEDAAKQLADFIRKHFSEKRVIGVMGVLADKEYDKIASHVLPLMDKAATITPDNARALQGEELVNTVKKYCPDVVYIGKAEKAMEWIQKEAGPEDVAVIFGSLSFMDQIGGL